MKNIKSLIFTLLSCGGILAGLYFIPIEKGKYLKKESKFPVVNEEDELLGINEEKAEIQPEEEKVEILPIIPVVEEPKNPENPNTEKEKIEQKPNETQTKKEAPNNENTQQTPPKPKKKDVVKESKIGVDRKLISGIPGTMKYKGKFPTHNVKEKGEIIIAYTVDKNGNVISAYRVGGLRGRNIINNAVSMVRKYVKAEKGKGNSTGTYTINFK
ncbi:MAG: hypothetical protein Q4A00_02545 [Flavobacteriaceae bacterium]|nr:hypothetical protein [Flavobacteriaceae bacterium]